MADFMDTLVKEAVERLKNGYYRTAIHLNVQKLSLKNAIINCQHAPIIAEIKPSSPSRGCLRHITSPVDVAKAMEAGGAVGISVLTEPKRFGGSLQALAYVKRSVGIPVLMKDIIVDKAQIEAAAHIGADAVLLIHGAVAVKVDELIEFAHSLGLEVLLETHTIGELKAALETEADMIGINNRDLKTLKVDLGVTARILAETHPNGRIVISESGIENADHVRFLRRCGANAFLVGSSIMLADDIGQMVRELVMAL
jgi:indole-3-glycerol phosphate synthase